MATAGRPNSRLRVERRRHGWTQDDLVERMYGAARNAHLATPRGLNANYISRWERGATQPERYHAHLLCLAFELPADRLGLPGDSEPRAATMGSGGADTERRTFLRYGAALVAGGTYEWLASQVESPRPIIDPLAILDYRAFGDAAEESQTLSALRAAVADAKRAYQACRYASLGAGLPRLLASLDVATETLKGDDRLAAYALSAEANHVAASVLLKHEDHGPAWIVADRSVRAAAASGDPLMVASSARILTHVFMSTGHNAAAATTAAKTAAQLAAAWSDPTADDLSVYGSLLLRGSIAAARQSNRDVAYELLDEAEQTARRLGRDDNRRVWLSWRDAVFV